MLWPLRYTSSSFICTFVYICEHKNCEFNETNIKKELFFFTYTNKHYTYTNICLTYFVYYQWFQQQFKKKHKFIVTCVLGIEAHVGLFLLYKYTEMKNYIWHPVWIAILRNNALCFRICFESFLNILLLSWKIIFEKQLQKYFGVCHLLII